MRGICWRMRDDIIFLPFNFLWDLLLDGDEEKTSGVGLVALYGKIQKVLIALPQESKNSVTILIDDVSLMEVATKGSKELVLDFLHYCHVLTSEIVRFVNFCFRLSACHGLNILLSGLHRVFSILVTGLFIGSACS